MKITNTAANTIHYEAQITDSRAQYGDGKAGLFFSGGADNIQFDNFSLQLR